MRVGCEYDIIQSPGLSRGSDVVQGMRNRTVGDTVPKEDAGRQWWEKKWQEREDALIEVFGESCPPGAREGHVLSLDMMWPKKWPKVTIPGACIQVSPPVQDGTHPTRIPRSDWLYLTLGLSQPEGPNEVPPQRSRDDLKNLSWFGAEFGVPLEAPENWVPAFLGE